MNVFFPELLYEIGDFKISKITEKQISIQKDNTKIIYYGDNSLLLELLEGIINKWYKNYNLGKIF